MGKNFVTTLGILVAVLPFITIPSDYKIPLYVMFGILIAYVSYKDKNHKRKGSVGSKRLRRVVENTQTIPENENMNNSNILGNEESKQENI